ncbi:hypothetical protein F7725_013561 [Dissostichus mawsoni]|uniref:DDE Tnp4 domain-containing protein n=1 Tax=Dissostichus mawsoni TaxID=36200 RepID=A0A7J5Y4B5_DISMA|nr:hypothetical protein F7725_013561 [Dissostichus mawsoni]
MENEVAREPRPLYCRINLTVPVLDRFFNDQDTRPDFRLSRESLNALLDLLGQERRHGWGATIETLVFLFWLACGTSYRVVSRAFGMPRSTVHRIVHRVTEEVVAIRHQVIYLPRTAEDLEAVSRGFAGLARHRAFRKAAGAIDGCHYILADGGYPCLQHPLPLITPYRQPLQGVGPQRFNSHHSRARSIIERAFGMMKTRFRSIFLKALECTTPSFLK